MLLPKHQIILAASLGAVVGFCLVVAALYGVELAAPLAILPALRRDPRVAVLQREAVDALELLWTLEGWQPESYPSFPAAPALVRRPAADVIPLRRAA